MHVTCKGYSEGWVKTIKNSIAQVAPHYTMKRQLDDYYAKFYTKEAKRFKELVANDYAKAKGTALERKELQNFGIPLKSFHVKRRKSYS